MDVQKITDAEFPQAINDNDLVVAKFYADWCGSCKLMAPKYRKLAQSDDYDKVSFLDINAEENPEARAKVGVTNLPFFATFRNGELVEADFTAKEDGVRKMIERLTN